MIHHAHGHVIKNKNIPHGKKVTSFLRRFLLISRYFQSKICQSSTNISDGRYTTSTCDGNIPEENIDLLARRLEGHTVYAFKHDASDFLRKRTNYEMSPQYPVGCRSD